MGEAMIAAPITDPVLGWQGRQHGEGAAGAGIGQGVFEPGQGVIPSAVLQGTDSGEGVAACGVELGPLLAGAFHSQFIEVGS
jgi:hypothetical protein